MKRKLLVFIFALMVIKLLADVSDEIFWKTVDQNDFQNAAKVARELSTTNSEYFALAALCYQNSFDYNNFSIMVNQMLMKETQDSTGNYFIKKMSEFSNSPILYLLVGQAKYMFHFDNLKPAEFYLQKSIELQKNNPFAYNYLAMVYDQKEEIEQALQSLELAIKYKSDYPEPYITSAYLFAVQNKEDRSLEMLLECIKKCKKAPYQLYESLIQLTCTESRELIVMNDQKYYVSAPTFKDEETRNLISNKLLKSPNHLLEMAEMFINQNSVSEANNLIENLKVSGDIENKLNYLKAEIQFLSGNLNEAEKIANLLITNKYSDYNHLLIMGTYFFQYGLYEKSIDYFNQSITFLDTLDIDLSMQIYSNIGTANFYLQNYDVAKENINKALDIYPYDSISYYTLAKIYIEENNNSDAIQLLEKAKYYCETEGLYNEINALLDSLQDKKFEIEIPSDVEKNKVMQNTEKFSDNFINSNIENIANLLSDNEICFNNSMFLTPSNFIAFFKPMRGNESYSLKSNNVYNFNDCISNSEVFDLVYSLKDYFTNAKLFSNIQLLNSKNEIVQIKLLFGKINSNLWKIESVNYSALNIYSTDENLKYPGGSKKWKMRKVDKGNLLIPLLKDFSPKKNTNQEITTFTNKQKTAYYEISKLDKTDSLFEKSQTIFYNQIKKFNYRDIIAKFIPNGYLFATTYNNNEEEICYHCAVIQNEENCFKVDFISSVEYYESKWYLIDFSLKSISLK